MYAWTVGFLIVFAGGSSYASAAGSCSSQNNFCMSYCAKSNPSPSCTDDCASRKTVCLQTGTYRWINSPTMTGLIRK